MLVRRLAAVGLLAAAAVPAVHSSAAQAHGAPVTPISRSAACAGNGTERSAAACKAALKATDGFIGAYDNLRLANVNGDDQARVPDGKLCSGGLDNYRGLDLARDDFPSTGVKSGQNLKITYRGTIPHQGSFRLYLTRAGYDPAEKLTWGDLTKLDEIKDPPLTGGSYRMSVSLPKRTGRHILYVVWETSSTPDTYYSCSDLVFPAAAPVATKAAAATSSPTPKASSSPARVVKSPSRSPSASSTPLLASSVEKTSGTISLGHWLIGGALAVALLAAAGAGVTRLRRRETR